MKSEGKHEFRTIRREGVFAFDDYTKCTQYLESISHFGLYISFVEQKY